MKFRKKPVVIEAVQYLKTDEKMVELLAFTRNESESGTSMVQIVNGGELSVHTLEGVMTAHEGDWIIKGVVGEFYPCKPDIFESNYEPVY